MQIAKNAVVEIDYTLTGPDGKVIDSSKGKPPMPYMHGTGNLIPGLEAALEGKKAGDKVNVTIQPGEAYGHKDASLVQVVPRTSFQGVKTIEVGMQFRASNGGQTRIVRVIGFEGDDIKLDANHPLAGVTLTFDVNIVSIREATAEELSHGHVHGPGGHHH
ncbi:MAG: peptidylprolyl isomerase [Planctomycetes bacterium]|nr:peptidylprolyl isomerase [Planctomycetota bacterium]